MSFKSTSQLPITPSTTSAAGGLRTQYLAIWQAGHPRSALTSLGCYYIPVLLSVNHSQHERLWERPQNGGGELLCCRRVALSLPISFTSCSCSCHASRNWNAGPLSMIFELADLLKQVICRLFGRKTSPCRTHHPSLES